MSKSRNIALTISLSLSIISVFTSQSVAMLYSWKDTAGNYHYANRQDDVPERYRQKVKILYPELSTTETTRTDSTASPQQANIQIPQTTDQFSPVKANITTPPVPSSNTLKESVNSSRKARRARPAVREE